MVYNDDSRLIKKIKECDDEESLKELVQRHEGLCFSMANNFYDSATRSGIFFDDLIDNKFQLIFNTAKKWDEERGVKFSTLLSNEARFCCLKKISQNKNNVNPEEIDWDSIPDKTKNKSQIELISIIFNELDDPKAKKILKLKFFSDKNISLRQISKKMGLSQQATLSLYNKILAYLKNKIESIDDFA